MRWSRTSKKSLVRFDRRNQYESMTESRPPKAVLRQLSLNGDRVAAIASYALIDQQLVIGREPVICQIVLDSQVYGGVSRQHAKICPSPTARSGWQVCDMASANGTYVNGKKVEGCWNLQTGDRISLSPNGAEFVFELEEPELPAPLRAPQNALQNLPQNAPMTVLDPQAGKAIVRPPVRRRRRQSSYSELVTWSQLFPILSMGRELRRKAYLVPGIVTVALVVMLFVSIGKFDVFNALLSAYIAGAAYYFVYQLCGKAKDWWVVVGAGLLTAGVLSSPLLNGFVYVFRVLLPGQIPQQGTLSLLPQVFTQMFFGAGLMEEIIKSIPLAIACWLGTRVRSPLRERIGIWEPLDGILIGTASAVGFTLLETLGQYVPSVVNAYMIQSEVSRAEGIGLQLLIARILGSIFGHMAYSGYLGYFFGLSMLKPKKRWQILAAGYLTAAVLHALWNTMGMFNLVVLALVGALSYAFLAAAILKARALSPTRSQNFATRFTRMD